MKQIGEHVAEAVSFAQQAMFEVAGSVMGPMRPAVPIVGEIERPFDARVNVADQLGPKHDPRVIGATLTNMASSYSGHTSRSPVRQISSHS